MKRTKKIVAICLVVLFCVAPTVQAGSVWCTGKVTGMIVDKNGDVTINGTYRNNWTKICNLNGTWGGIGTVTCTMWVKLLDDAYKYDTSITIKYISGSCANLPTWGGSLAPIYVRPYNQ